MRQRERRRINLCEMDTQSHWNRIYSTGKSSERSWFRPHLDTSLALIERYAADRGAAVIDVGGGESTLADDLIAAGYRDITVLDASQAVLERVRARLGPDGERIVWVCGDILSVQLPHGRFSVWHDRAVFHFLTERAERAAYVRQAASAVKQGGDVIVGAFGSDGPKKCSGLDVIRYDAASLYAEFGSSFRLVESLEESHRTPSGAMQPFVYCHFLVL